MRINPESLAKASSRHPWRTVGIWVVVLVAGIVSASTLLGPALTTDIDFTNSPEAKRAQQILEEQYNVGADVWSVTSYVNLYRDGHACERWNRLHPADQPRVLRFLVDEPRPPHQRPVAEHPDVHRGAPQLSRHGSGAQTARSAKGLLATL